MNYAELQTAIIEDTHRADLIDLVPRFIREGEDMIRRDLTAYLLTAIIDDTARVKPGEPIYTLPDHVLMLRRVTLHGQTGPELTRINLGELPRYPLQQRVAIYAEPGDNTIEVRGNPSEQTKIYLNYYGMPERLAADEDTNTLLDENTTLYKSAAMFFLYQHTQDRELASDAQDIFNGVLGTLNEEIARKIGGVKIAPGYNFGSAGTY